MIRIEIPALRERRADIPALTGAFVEKLNRQMGRRVRGLDPDARDLGEPFTRLSHSPRTGRLRDQERDLIERILAKHGGNRTRAAEELGISRRTLFNKIREAGIDS